MKVVLEPGKYVLAVSGGVDSMALLDMIATDKHLSAPDYKFIVAHYDHGIRKDSSRDRKIVEKAAKEYGLPFEYEEGRLGKSASEAKAREARYAFLRRVLRSRHADAIVTAHHRDDALETLIINILRGTGRRGVLKETTSVKRPLLNVSKEEIKKYAKAHSLKWHEDETNLDTKYLRNYIRQVLLPKMKKRDPKAIDKLLRSNSSLTQLNVEIDSSIDDLMRENCLLTNDTVEIPRHWLIMTPNTVGREIIYEAIRHLDKRPNVDRKNLKALLVFAKTAKLHKKMPINSSMNIRIEPKKIIVELV